MTVKEFWRENIVIKFYHLVNLTHICQQFLFAAFIPWNMYFRARQLTARSESKQKILKNVIGQ